MAGQAPDTIGADTGCSAAKTLGSHWQNHADSAIFRVLPSRRVAGGVAEHVGKNSGRGAASAVMATIAAQA